jgi:lactate permease
MMVSFDTISLLGFLLALSPIVVVLVLMIGFRWGGDRAGPAAWVVALLVAVLFFGADASVLLTSQIKGLMLTLFVLYIIWMALVLFHVVNESGAIAAIGRGISRLTADKALQLLILAWVFSAFLEGVAGFGVPIAVIAPLLIGMGFAPVTAVVSVATGHAWAVTLGNVGVPFNALVAVTGLSGAYLAPWTAGLLGLACFGCGLASAHSYQGFRSMRRVFPAVLLIGLAMAGTQYALAVNGTWNLSGFVAAMVGLGVSVLVSRLPWYRNRGGHDREAVRGNAESSTSLSLMPFPMAVAAYLALIVVVVVAELVPAAHAVLNSVNLQLPLPATETGLGWVVAAQPTKAISVFGHPGALIAYTAAIAYLLYRLSGYYRPGVTQRIVENTLQSAVRSSIGIAAMVGFAMIMEYTGMTYLLAVGLSRSVEPLFPVLAPFIGVLGTFMTGSNTNSNVVFGGLQIQTAELLGVSAAVVLGAQTAGASLGSMLAPAKIIVGCSTAGLAGREGEVLRRTILYGVLIVLAVGAVAWIAVQ